MREEKEENKLKGGILTKFPQKTLTVYRKFASLLNISELADLPLLQRA